MVWMNRRFFETGHKCSQLRIGFIGFWWALRHVINFLREFAGYHVVCGYDRTCHNAWAAENRASPVWSDWNIRGRKHRLLMLTPVATEQAVQSLHCPKSNSVSEENKTQPSCFRLAHVHVQMSLAAGIKGSDQILIILAQKIKQWNV